MHIVLKDGSSFDDVLDAIIFWPFQCASEWIRYEQTWQDLFLPMHIHISLKWYKKVKQAHLMRLRMPSVHLDTLDTKREGQHFHDKPHHDFSFGLSGNRFPTFWFVLTINQSEAPCDWNQSELLVADQTTVRVSINAMLWVHNCSQCLMAYLLSHNVYAS